MIVLLIVLLVALLVLPSVVVYEEIKMLEEKVDKLLEKEGLHKPDNKEESLE